MKSNTVCKHDLATTHSTHLNRFISEIGGLFVTGSCEKYFNNRFTGTSYSLYFRCTCEGGMFKTENTLNHKHYAIFVLISMKTKEPEVRITALVGHYLYHQALFNNFINNDSL